MNPHTYQSTLPRAHQNGPIEDVRDSAGNNIGYRSRKCGRWVKFLKRGGYQFYSREYSPVGW